MIGNDVWIGYEAVIMPGVEGGKDDSVSEPRDSDREKTGDKDRSSKSKGSSAKSESAALLASRSSPTHAVHVFQPKTFPMSPANFSESVRAPQALLFPSPTTSSSLVSRRRHGPGS